MGDVFIVKPGQAIPTDGVVQIGTSNVNQAPVTGESVPVEKNPGATVFAGTINEEAGAGSAGNEEDAADNTIPRIIHMVEEAQEKKGQSQRFIERFGKRYSPAVLLARVLIAVVPPLLFGASWEMWLEHAVSFHRCRCSLCPGHLDSDDCCRHPGHRHTQWRANQRRHLCRNLAKVKVVALDKTGTLAR